MILDFLKEYSPKSLEADVCVVGAGAAGIPLALSLARAGLTVVMTESGHLHPGEADQLNYGEVAGGVAYTGLESGRARALGGSTKLWYGQCIRLDGIDFARRAWIPHSGWPIVAADLDPYYRRAEEFFAIAGESYDATLFRRFNLIAPEFEPGKLVPHFTIYSPEVDLGRIHRRAVAEQEHLTLLCGATVVEVLTNETASQATGVRMRALSGREGIVRAKSVVLCAGGIENARLLLLSDKVQKSGLGNDRDLVGRFLQDHPNGQTATLETENIRQVLRLFSLLYEPPLRFFPKLALSPVVQEEEKVLNCNGHFVFEYPEGSGIAAGKEIYRSLRRGKLPPNWMHHLSSIFTDLPQTISAARQFFVDKQSPSGMPSRIRFQCYLEQEPDPLSRVELSTATDLLGERRTRVSWKISELERRTLEVMTRTVGQEMARLGLGQLTPDDWITDVSGNWRNHLADAFHPIGTTRMASSAADGVVDSNCQVFGIDNLYVAGSSVFPTSGYANPTLTLVTFALRLADLLLLRLRGTH